MNQELKEIIKSDIYRNFGNHLNVRQIISKFIFQESRPWKYILVFRLAQAYYTKGGIIGNLVKRIYNRFSFKYGYEISPKTKIGKGLRLPHRGGIIVIHGDVIIGEQCEIMQGVTIGNNIVKSRDKVAVIGNCVTVCAGAKIIGGVTIGDNVIVGANSVVTKDIPPCSVVAGIPAKIIKCNVIPPIVYQLNDK